MSGAGALASEESGEIDAKRSERGRHIISRRIRPKMCVCVRVRDCRNLINDRVRDWFLVSSIWRQRFTCCGQVEKKKKCTCAALFKRQSVCANRLRASSSWSIIISSQAVFVCACVCVRLVTVCLSVWIFVALVVVVN